MENRHEKIYRGGRLNLKNILPEIKKHLKIYAQLVKISIMVQLEYRANFFLGILVECTYLVTKLLYVFITQTTGNLVGGLTPDQIMLFVGTFMILTALYVGLFSWNFWDITYGVTKGEFDMLIVKPVSLQFLVTTRFVNISVPIPNIIAGVILICAAWNRMGLAAGAVNILLFIYFIICGTVIAYSIFLIPHLSAFWTVKTGSISELSSRMWDFNNMPMQIYNKWWQRIGVFVIPIFIITNFPVMALFDNLPPVYLAWGTVVPIALLITVRRFWKFAIKRYSSAGG